MTRATFVASLAASLTLGALTPYLAAEAAETQYVHRPENDAAAQADSKAAAECMSDLRDFDRRLQQGGEWQSGSGFGFGYPIYDFGYPEGGVLLGRGAGEARSYWRARPGYEVRTLVAAASILALHGKQRACEALLTESRDVYQRYAADLRTTNAVKPDQSGWRSRMIAAAEPVAAKGTAFRSDQLIGTEVVNPKTQDLGSVQDIVLSPNTDKIAYLVIGRGGVFGFDEKYVPVPWSAFKVTVGEGLLVLNATKADMDAAPQVPDREFSSSGDFALESAHVNAFWVSHIGN
jgi:sporulation protein YlmC with PRC-barrel domain